MLTALGIVISFRIWTIRSEAPKDVINKLIVSLRRTFNDYTGMGMRNLTSSDDYLRESLPLQKCSFELSCKYSTYYSIYNEFKIPM
jgi:hypothetical protein